MKTTRTPVITPIEQFWFKYDFGLKVTGWMLVVSSITSAMVWH